LKKQKQLLNITHQAVELRPLTWEFFCCCLSAFPEKGKTKHSVQFNSQQLTPWHDATNGGQNNYSACNR